MSVIKNVTVYIWKKGKCTYDSQSTAKHVGSLFVTETDFIENASFLWMVESKFSQFRVYPTSTGVPHLSLQHPRNRKYFLPFLYPSLVPCWAWGVNMAVPGLLYTLTMQTFLLLLHPSGHRTPRADALPLGFPEGRQRST